MTSPSDTHLASEDLLRKALKWALKEGIRATSYGCGFVDSGCGCCSGEEEPPADIDAIVREVRREILEKQ